MTELLVYLLTSFFAFGLQSVREIVTKLWDELPREIKTSSSRFIFLKNYKDTY